MISPPIGQTGQQNGSQARTRPVPPFRYARAGFLQRQQRTAAVPPGFAGFRFARIQGDAGVRPRPHPVQLRPMTEAVRALDGGLR